MSTRTILAVGLATLALFAVARSRVSRSTADSGAARASTAAQLAGGEGRGVAETPTFQRERDDAVTEEPPSVPLALPIPARRESANASAGSVATATDAPGPRPGGTATPREPSERADPPDPPTVLAESPPARLLLPIGREVEFRPEDLQRRE